MCALAPAPHTTQAERKERDEQKAKAQQAEKRASDAFADKNLSSSKV